MKLLTFRRLKFIARDTHAPVTRAQAARRPVQDPPRKTTRDGAADAQRGPAVCRIRIGEPARPLAMSFAQRAFQVDRARRFSGMSSITAKIAMHAGRANAC